MMANSQGQQPYDKAEEDDSPFAHLIPGFFYFLVPGFAAYFILNSQWLYLVLALIAPIILTFILRFVVKQRPQQADAGD